MNASIKPDESFYVDELQVKAYSNPEDMAGAVAREVQEHLRDRLAQQGSATAILATGNSQVQFLEQLVALGEVDWAKITLFHLDEYLGVAPEHPASFQRYLRERVASKVNPKTFHFLAGDTLEPIHECNRYARLLRAQAIDLCCLGIGENGHLAFNDPPVANFEDPYLVKIVKLDDPCKNQQVNEGHFPSLEAVPPYALTLTIPALCLAKKIVCIVPEKRKAEAVRKTLRGPISTACPASILRRCPQATLLLDTDSASLLP